VNAALMRIPCEVPPFSLSGTLYVTLLSHRSALEAVAAEAGRPPYNALPRSPVLYLKPRNTLAADGDPVEIPAGIAELEAAACLGIVIGRTACRVSEATALDHVAGFLIVNDVSVPHSSYFRPAVRYRARDGFCPLGPRVTPRASIADPDAVVMRTYVDDALAQTAGTADLVRPAARLLAEVTEFMTLAPGDVLATGAAAPAPRVRAGQSVRIEIDGLGALTNLFVAGAHPFAVTVQAAVHAAVHAAAQAADGR
jgi:5-oxopent-3-ene-1,2,5-tricarboxylate decarboxylase/2-hydroxyhepta-2,4-diene-1,7-dioate isomerase